MGFPFFILFAEPIPTISIFLFKSIFFTSPPLNFANSPSKELQNYIFAKKGKKNVKIKKSSKPHKAQLQLTRSTSTGLSVLNVWENQKSSSVQSCQPLLSIELRHRVS
jgi:hypothetical protein